ncbi:imidazole glycerol phosphate synthase subunit HisH [Chitinispirillales bacterium ANBcel5]|uniref:imidazole glycerol phosphate synthase subunit HisH n=1 Tax=Cellulosispirillum alkaliphilum TaxID=3039283 RepID=UPI002A5881A1|nr:imidazole glycerol phosphate synthase subunit HisH [Chitinispirillales bacterium ANBcel5]
MIAIIDYNSGNLTSVKRALDHLKIPNCITSDPKNVRNAERIIFPGVGHASTAMEVLRKTKLDVALKDALSQGTPILGICLGTQIILSHSQEGNTSCLGLIEGECVHFKLKNPDLKIPHMGWNSITTTRHHPVLEGFSQGVEFYFVHSYYPAPVNHTLIIGVCEYEIEFPAIIGQNNLIATQFHPEKSGRTGLRLLQNFSQWNGKDA